MRRKSSSSGPRCLIVAAMLALAAQSAAAADPSITTDDGADRTALFDAVNAVRARIDAGHADGDLPRRIGALEARIDTLGHGADRAHVAIHLGRSEVLFGDIVGGDGRLAARARAARLFRGAADDASSAEAPRLAAYAWGYLGELYLDAGRGPEARIATQRAIAAAGRADAPDASYRFFAQLARLERQTGDLDAATRAYREAIAIIARVSDDLASESLDAAFAFHERVEPVYVGFVDVLLERASAAVPDEAEPLLREARDALEALKTAELRDHFGDDCLAEQKRVAPDDVPGAAVLYPMVLPDRVELIVGRGGRLTLHRSPMTPGELERHLADMRRHVASPLTRRYQRPAAALFAALIEPIESRLDGAEVLVVIPGGALRTIPFTALYDAKRGAHLVERIAVVVSPGLTLTDPRPFPGADTRVLTAGLSEARLGYPALPNVQEEISGIARSFPTTELMNASLTGERLDHEVETRAVGVVHIASHGEFNAEASESFLVTWDEKLPMKAFAATIARTARRNEAPLELLVLSACETAAGDERAALGLAGIAIQSGARSAVATLWSVNDRATRQLIDRFYRELARGRSRAEALRAAQLELVADPTFSHPAFWSPFLLVSSWL